MDFGGKTIRLTFSFAAVLRFERAYKDRQEGAKGQVTVFMYTF